MVLPIQYDYENTGPLVATSFTEDQVKAIMSPLLKVTLNLCGIQKRLPWPLLYGPLHDADVDLRTSSFFSWRII